MSVARLPAPITIGFMPREASDPGARDWLKSASVREVCSMSTCLRKPPDGWIEHWLHNEAGLYDTESLALSICPPELKFDMFAYGVVPLIFDPEGTRPLALAVHPDTIPATYRMLGYDVVCWEDAGTYGKMVPSFGCSPLSCNGMAKEIKVNESCLIDDLSLAVEVPRMFYEGHCEPGPYVIAQVWRKQL